MTNYEYAEGGDATFSGAVVRTTMWPQKHFKTYTHTITFFQKPGVTKLMRKAPFIMKT